MRDFLNRKQKRNEKNTKTLIYNCAGYALRTFSWYDPYNGDMLRMVMDLYFRGFNKETIRELLLRKSKRKILKDFAGKIRVIENEDDLYDTEELVVFRLELGYDEKEGNFNEDNIDFHFRVLRNNKWMEKCGKSDISQTTNPFVDEWINKDEDEEGHGYDGNYLIFALKI